MRICEGSCGCVLIPDIQDCGPVYVDRRCILMREMLSRGECKKALVHAACVVKRSQGDVPDAVFPSSSELEEWWTGIYPSTKHMTGD